MLGIEYHKKIKVLEFHFFETLNYFRSKIMISVFEIKKVLTTIN